MDNIRQSTFLYDMTQFFMEPLTTGIQKVSFCVLRELRREYAISIFIVINAKEICVLPEDSFSLIEAFFRDGSIKRADLLSYAASSKSDRHSIGISDVILYRGLINPEVFYWHERVEFYNILSQTGGSDFPVQFIIYDALPWLHPEMFATGAITTTMEYLLLIGKIQRRIFISKNAYYDFTRRIFRREKASDVVSHPGVDELDQRRSRSYPRVSTFLAVGTIEPRKNYDILIEAFIRIWSSGGICRLILVGRLGWCNEITIKNINSLENQPLFQWIKNGTDEQLHAALISSSCLIYLSEHEGYGLPPLEGLAAGLPVIASRKIPAFEAINDDGQIRLDTISVQSVIDACSKIEDPISHKALIDNAQQVVLPSWASFARDIIENMKT